jgi:2-polyprenyl-3-methyl-5-hydroxy-6-metoxy-1,4-benzoquinol methylase
MTNMKSLLIGCGNSREKFIKVNGDPNWGTLTTLDFDSRCKPDILHDLNKTPWPIENEVYDEIHAYDVLEHLGTQGDYKVFFDHFYECWRSLKTGGFLCASTPNDQNWIWGDPGHSRLISKASITFLAQSEYTRQVGNNSMTDYRWYWKGDLRLKWENCKDCRYWFVLQKFNEIGEVNGTI